MTDGPEQVQRLAAALRAQASGFPAVPAGQPGPEPGPTPEQASSGRRPRRAERAGSGLPAWAVLALATLLGAAAGGLAGVVSAW